jgi:maleate isomerase
MIGWRARLGLMVPSINVLMEYEFNLMAPEGVSVHCARLPVAGDILGNVKQLDKNSIVRTNEAIPKAAIELQHAEVDVIGIGSTAGGWALGLEEEIRLINLVEEKVNIPVSTATIAVMEAMQKLGMKRIVVATPYVEELNRKGKEFLEANGFDVLTMQTIGELAHTVSPGRVYRFAKKLYIPEADGIFISCTDFRTIEILQALENDIGKPVVSSSQALMWKMLQVAKVHESIKGFGSLLAT